MNQSDAGQFSVQAIDERTVRVRPGVRYDANRNFFLEAAYPYSMASEEQRGRDGVPERGIPDGDIAVPAV